MGAGWSDRDDNVEPEWMHHVDMGLRIFIGVALAVTVVSQTLIWWLR